MTTTEEVTMTDDKATELVTLDDVRKLFEKKGSERLREQMAQGVVNPIELARVLGVRPQMIYNYIRKGAIKKDAGVGVNSTQKVVISLDVAMKWARVYLDRKAQQKARIDRELAGE